MCDQQRLRPAYAYMQSDQSLCLSLKYSMSVEILTEHHLEFVSLKRGCIDPSASTLVEIPLCWKSRHGSENVSFGGLQTTQAQTSLRNGAICSAPLLFAFLESTISKLATSEILFF